METTTGGAGAPPPEHGGGWLTVGKIAKVLLWLVYAWVIIDLVLLALAFVLLLLGASPDAGFVEFVYRSVQRVMAPFRGMFEPIPLNGDSVLDTSLLFAMIVYTFVALFLRWAIDWLTAKLTPAHRAAPARPPRPAGPPRAVDPYGQPVDPYRQPGPPPQPADPYRTPAPPPRPPGTPMP
jgi:uncharacterized protein YggT (Ycf19 family)